MKRLSKIISLISAAAAGICLTSATDSSYASESSWQKDYLEVIANYSPESYPDATFELFYINEDDIPELYVETGDFVKGVKLFTHYDDKVALCLEASYRGTLWLHSSKNGYFSQSHGVSAGYETFYDIIKLENGVCNNVYEFYHDGRIMADGTHDIYTINGEEVSQSEFESRQEELNAEYSLISDYTDRDPVVRYSYDEMYKYLSAEIVPDETSEPTSTEAPDNTSSEAATENIASANNSAAANNASPQTGDKGVFGAAALGLAVIGVSLSSKKMMRKSK